MVMVGRDIGTNVLPNAPLKVYLDASPQQRAQRALPGATRPGEEADLATELRELQRSETSRTGDGRWPLFMPPLTPR